MDHNTGQPARVAQSETCLAADASLTEDPGAESLIPPGPILSLRLIMKYFLLSTVILLHCDD